MAKSADALIAIWDYQCRRTRNIIRQATENGLEVFVPNFPEWPVWREVDDRGKPVLFVREGGITIRFSLERGSQTDRSSGRDVVAIYFDGVPGRDREERHQNSFLMNSFDAASIHPILAEYHEQLVVWSSDVQRAPCTVPRKADCPARPEQDDSVPTVLFMCGHEPLTRTQRQALPQSREIFGFGRACFSLRNGGPNLMIEAMQPVMHVNLCDVRHGKAEIRGEQLRFISGDSDFRVSTVCAAMPAGVEPLQCFQSSRMQQYAARVPLWWLSPEGCWFRLTRGGTIIEEPNIPA